MDHATPGPRRLAKRCRSFNDPAGKGNTIRDLSLVDASRQQLIQGVGVPVRPFRGRLKQIPADLMNEIATDVLLDEAEHIAPARVRVQLDQGGAGGT